MSSPQWNPYDPHYGGRPPQTGGWAYGGPPPVARPPVSPGPAQHMRPAGFGVRLAARLIDYFLALIAAAAFFVLMAVIVVLLTGQTETTDAEGELWGFLFLFGWGLLLFFYDWLYLVAWGRTLGKMMLGVKVVDATDGGKLSQGQAIGRSAFFCLPQSLPCLGQVFALSESMAMLGDDRGRSLHDRVTGTRVVHTR